jgi:hypothetical protein
MLMHERRGYAYTMQDLPGYTGPLGQHNLTSKKTDRCGSQNALTQQRSMKWGTPGSRIRQGQASAAMLPATQGPLPAERTAGC